MDKEIIICECNSAEHQLIFLTDEDDFYCQVHLSTYHNFFKRCWIAIKYIFGYKCRYGNWDSIIISREDICKLQKFLDKKIKCETIS